MKELKIELRRMTSFLMHSRLKSKKEFSKMKLKVGNSVETLCKINKKFQKIQILMQKHFSKKKMRKLNRLLMKSKRQKRKKPKRKLKKSLKRKRHLQR